MLINTRTIRIEWGDCDPAGIVWYPNYFGMFDTCTHHLFERALGMTKINFTKKYGFLGYPMVDTRARFLRPARFGDDVVVESQVTEFKRSSFDLVHRLSKDGELAVECFETRVWAGHDPNKPGAIKSQPIPQDVIDRFAAG